MFTTYVLYSKTFDKIYIGYTADLEKRLSAHNYKANKGWTARFQPWELLHAEQFETKEEAIQREKQLKSSKGRRFIRTSLLGP